MSTLTINDLDPVIAEALQSRASEHGHSVEAEVREILSDVVGGGSTAQIGLAEAIRRRFAPFGGVDDLAIPPRDPAPDLPTFDP